MNENIIEQARKDWNIKKGKRYRYRNTDYNLLDKGNGEYSIFIQASGSWEKDRKDWIRNFMAWSVKYNMGGETFYIHAGFFEAFSELLEDLMPRIKDAKEVSLSGTSLGGATAQILNIYLQLETDIKVKSVTTFGSPIPFVGFGKGYVRALCLSVENIHYRINNDIVPTLPPIGYKAVGTRVQIKTDNKPKNLKEFLFRGFYDHASYWKELKNG